MKRLLTIVGARPQIIKAAAISREIKNHYADRVEELILHTGQHYDDNMSDMFFRELGIPAPDYNLHVGSMERDAQIRNMVAGIENVLDKNTFDAIIVYGDTNSTLAGALAASKRQIPLYHIEAGLRSFNPAMPEEINRIETDKLSTVLFAPTQTAVRNLENEQIMGRVVLSGDVMYDNALYFSRLAATKSNIIERMGLEPDKFVLATIHRPVNTDNETNLQTIFRALTDIAAEGMEVVVPLHPRTRARMGKDARVGNVKIIEPVGFYDIIRLEQSASVVMTDSGGVQKEAFFYGTPSVILRAETEWVEITDAGAGILAEADYARIMAAYKTIAGKKIVFPPLFGDGHAAEHILKEIVAEG